MSTAYHSRHTGAAVDDAVDRADALWIINSASYSGTGNLANGISSGSVVGLELGFVPIRAFLQVESPSGGYIMFAVAIRDSYTFESFDFELSGITDSDQYKLHYLLIGEAAAGGSGESGSSVS